MLRALFAAALLAGCSSGDNDDVRVESNCSLNAEKEPLTRTCYPEPLNVDADADSSNYGRVPCAVIDAGPGDTAFCECARPGFRPASIEQAAVARDYLDRVGACNEGCCEHLCFCELLQFSGNELAYCQDRASEAPTDELVGWCYIEPGRGFGDATRTEACPSIQQQRIRFMPDGLVTSGQTAVLACLD